MQGTTHIFRGMRRDTHPIKQNPQFLWEAHNVRLTSRNGESNFSITSERGTREILRLAIGELYIGHCVIGNYLILFTRHDNIDTIYRFIVNDEKRAAVKEVLFRGDLNLDVDHPVQAISSYEAPLIQKVYWTDSKNSPRVINISKPELLGVDASDNYTYIYNDAPFDFVQELDLNEKVLVNRLTNSTGTFPSGVIQYAFSYYHKYGQESNIFHVTEPLYISHADRGGSPEDNIKTAFNIEVQGVQKSFTHLRIYSIIRTSIDSQPTVKRVTDIDIANIEGSVTYVDNGTTGDIVDPTMLLYLGGKDIVAGCIASKDNVLFLGDITYKRDEVQSIEGIESLIKDLPIDISYRKEFLSEASNSEVGPSWYTSQLLKNTSTFKVGETYRLGVQFQYKNGEWSEPLFISDSVMTGNRPSIEGQEITLPTFISSIDPIRGILADKGYIKARPLIVQSGINDRTILAQGILCPTVFNAGSRLDNSPFSQASWFLRPFSTLDPSTANKSKASIGAIAEFRHYNPLLTGFDGGSEVQNMFLDTQAKSNIENTLDTSLKSTREAFTGDKMDSSYKAMYYVDQSILTFHSPDVEFNDSLTLSLTSGNQYKVKLVGIVPFDINYGDIDIQTSSVVADPDAAGYIHQSIINDSNGARSLISGLFYEDAFVDEATNASRFAPVKGSIRPWLTYLWHRVGSLNNDVVRPEGKGAQTSVLRKKIISNLKVSKNTVWIKGTDPIDIDTDMQVFNSNEVSLLKFRDTNNSNGDITYYGNVDSMNPSYSEFRLVTGNRARSLLQNIDTQFDGHILIPTKDGAVKTPFSVMVRPIYGNLSNNSMSGTIISDSIIHVPSQDTDNDSVESTISLSLKGAEFVIVIGDRTVSSFKKYTGFIIPANSNTPYDIEGETSIELEYAAGRKRNAIFDFDSALQSVDPQTPTWLDKLFESSISAKIGDYHTGLKLPKDAVRIKYKSTPHIVLANKYSHGTRTPLPIIEGTSESPVSPEDIYWTNNPATDIIQHKYPASIFGLTYCPINYLWLAEIHQDNVVNRFGGNTPEALRDNLWIPAGPPIRLDSSNLLEWQWGDTWYQRYDCLKTYPFTQEDENQVVEIGSFMCETRVNIDGRYDRNRGAISNLNMSPTNFNLVNPVYSQMNTFFNYRMLDSDYYKVNNYPTRLIWTGVKSPAAIQDEWTNLHTASSMDLDGSNGPVTAIQPFNELLLGFQESSVQQILFNSRIQIQATDGVPIEIANSQRVEGTRVYSNTIGCQDKFSMATTPKGIYFVDSKNKSIMLFNGELVDLSLQLGSLYWPRDNCFNNSWVFKPTMASYRNGIRVFYDPRYQDVYFVPGLNHSGSANEALCYSEQLGQFTSLMQYGGGVMFPIESGFYSIAEDFSDGALTLWKNFESDGHTFNRIFGRNIDTSITFISNDNPSLAKIFDTIDVRADKYLSGNLTGDDLTHINMDGKPFNFIRVDNEYQDTGVVTLNDSNFRKKFRVWRIAIPRNKGTRERIRNTWAKITLGNIYTDSSLSILHDLSVKYTI